MTGRRPTGARRGRALRAAAAAALALAAAALGGLALALPGDAPRGAGGLGWNWYKTDTHVHSSISGDAAPDLGIIATSAKSDGYNALFLTDHNLASTFPVSIQTSVDVHLDDAMPRWFPITVGAPTSFTNALVGAPAPIDSGTLSLHLQATTTAGIPGEASVWTKRGASLRSGDDVLTFAVNPKTVPAGAGLYVSASLGGDPTVAPPPGYTTSSGVVSPGKSKVFIYYIGAPPPASLYAGSQLFTFNLLAAPAIPGHFSCDRSSLVLNAWTHCTINISRGLSLVAGAERPLDYDAFTDLKIGAVASGGNVDAFFDSYNLKAAAPQDAAGEYVFRNGIISGYDTPDFKIYPSVELGVGDHVGRFDFGFSDPAQFRSYRNGIDGIAETQAGGYPAQIDHPGVPGGVTDQEAVDNNAFGADAMEVRFQNMIDDWDGILSKGVILSGSWATDNHLGRWSAGSQATYLQAPTLGFDDLMRSLYEGRSYLAINAFGGRVIFGPDATSPDPHPSRYPIFVSSAQTTASAHLAVTAGIVPGSTVVWITDGGAVLATDPAPAASYDAVRQVPLTAPTTYVRAEVRDPSLIQDAMTQPIMWKQVPGLPLGMTVGVEGVTTPNGIGYTNVTTKGATGVGWDAGQRALSVTLENPAGSLVDMRATTAGQAAANVAVGGNPVPRVGSLAEAQAAIGPAWASEAGVMRVRGAQGAAATPAVVTFAGGGDVQPPTAPTGLVATLTGPTQVTLGWGASSDAGGVAAYDVYRDGLPIARLAAGTSAHVDAALGLGETHRYAVDAVDAAGNQSLQSNVVTVATASPGTPPPPPPPPPPTTTDGVTPPPPKSPLLVVQGAFRGAASQAHGEGFGVSLSLAVGRRPFALAGRPLRPLRLVVSGQSIVQDPTRARATLRLSGLPGRRLTAVSYGGTLYVARGSGRFRTAVGALRRTLPPLVASGFGQSPATFAGGLVKLRDLGPIVVGVSGSRRYRAQLTPAALKRYLTGLLVQGGLAPATSRAVVARARVTLNRVDIQVVSGQLDRVSIALGASLGPARGKTPAPSVSVRANVDLTDYGAELAVRRPAAKGVVSRLAQLG